MSWSKQDAVYCTTGSESLRRPRQSSWLGAQRQSGLRCSNDHGRARFWCKVKSGSFQSVWSWCERTLRSAASWCLRTQASPGYSACFALLPVLSNSIVVMRRRELTPHLAERDQRIRGGCRCPAEHAVYARTVRYYQANLSVICTITTPWEAGLDVAHKPRSPNDMRCRCGHISYNG